MSKFRFIAVAVALLSMNCQYIDAVNTTKHDYIRTTKKSMGEGVTSSKQDKNIKDRIIEMYMEYYGKRIAKLETTQKISEEISKKNMAKNGYAQLVQLCNSDKPEHVSAALEALDYAFNNEIPSQIPEPVSKIYAAIMLLSSANILSDTEALQYIQQIDNLVKEINSKTKQRYNSMTQEQRISGCCNAMTYASKIMNKELKVLNEAKLKMSNVSEEEDNTDTYAERG